MVGAGVGIAVGGAIRYVSSGGDWNEVFNPTAILTDAAFGAVGGAGGGRALTAFTSNLSNTTKGLVGEGMARAGIFLRGEKVIDRGVRAVEYGATGRAGRSVPDFIIQKTNGTTGYVEAKFGKSTLTGAQRALQQQEGDAFRISRTSYDDVGKLTRNVRYRRMW